MPGPRDVGSEPALSSLRGHGFVVLRGLLAVDEVAALREAFAATEPGCTEHVDPLGVPHGEVWSALPARPPLDHLVPALLGDEVTAPRIHGRNPMPGGGAQGLHADQPPAPPGPPTALTAIWMLDPFTVEGGATRVVPGSHRARRSVPSSWAQPGRRHPDEVLVEGAPGDLLLLDAHTWHGGTSNRSTHPRRSVQITWTRRAAPPGAR